MNWEEEAIEWLEEELVRQERDRNNTSLRKLLKQLERDNYTEKNFKKVSL